MRRTAPEGHGPVRYGPPLARGRPARAARTRPPCSPRRPAARRAPSPSAAARPARRRLRLLGPARPAHRPATVAAAAPGAPALLLALTAALGGDVLRAAALRRLVGAVGTPARPARLPRADPAECGGVPDPYALLETVRRVRAEGGDPRLLVLSVADDPTATVAPPELLHETRRGRRGGGPAPRQRRDLARHPAPPPRHRPARAPPRCCPDQVTVLTDLAGALLPAGWPAAVARFPATARTATPCAPACSTCSPRSAPASPAPVAAAAAYALGEPDAVTARVAAAVACTRAWPPPCTPRARRGRPGPAPAGRPPPLRRPRPAAPALAAHGVGDAQELEDLLTAPARHARARRPPLRRRPRRAAGAAVHRPAARRDTDEERAESLTSPEPLELPHVQRALSDLESVFDDLRDDAQRWEPPR